MVDHSRLGFGSARIQILARPEAFKESCSMLPSCPSKSLSEISRDQSYRECYRRWFLWTSFMPEGRRMEFATICHALLHRELLVDRSIVYCRSLELLLADNEIMYRQHRTLEQDSRPTALLVCVHARALSERGLGSCWDELNHENDHLRRS